jgi:EAL domain-containing protein (putative c-di-GMP-specific phosphodiesterase class I)
VTNFGNWLEAIQRRRSGVPSVRSVRGLPGVLARGDLSVVYQPIVSLNTMEPFAYEALVRSD